MSSVHQMIREVKVGAFKYSFQAASSIQALGSGSLHICLLLLYKMSWTLEEPGLN